MNKKFSFMALFAMLTISVLLFSGCEGLIDWLLEGIDGTEENDDNNGYNNDGNNNDGNITNDIYGFELTGFTASKNTALQYENETIIITIGVRNAGTETFPGGQRGLALVAPNGTFIIIASVNTTEWKPRSSITDREMNCVIPNSITPGVYQLRKVFRPTDGEWGIVTQSSDGVPVSINFTVLQNPRIVVPPLIQTQWSQYSPYNDLFPIASESYTGTVDNAGRLVTDCGNTALAQIINYHRHPVRGTGQSNLIMVQNVAVPTVNLNVAYDWNYMLNSYSSTNPGTERQRNAAATLIYHVGAANGANGFNYPGSFLASMTTNFGYDKSIQMHYRNFYTIDEWESIIKQQLDAKLPVYKWGHSPGSSNAFIIDGYDNQGKFHINMGWGGTSHGWYSLDDINPRGERAWYENQHIIVNIMPDKGGEPADNNRFGITNFTASSTTVQRNTSFSVPVTLQSFSFFPGGNFGIALVNNSNDEIVHVVGTSSNINSILPRGSISRTITCTVPNTVTPGQYRLMAVTRPTDGKWKLVTLFDREAEVPNTINITVQN